MSKTIKFILEYREKREKKEVELVIEKVNNWCEREFKKLAKELNNVSKMQDKLMVIYKDKGSALFDGKNKKPGWKEDIQSLEKQELEIKDKINKFDENWHFQSMFNIIHELLEFNGCKHEFLYEFDFWDRNVSPSDMMQLISKAIYKDLEQPKRQGGQPKK